MISIALAPSVAALVHTTQPAGAKSANGALGLLFVLLLAVAVGFLFRSMNKHLRKAQRMKLDEQSRDRDDDT